MRNSYRFCALAVAISICGCAHKVTPPPPPPTAGPHAVSLQVQGGSSGFTCSFSGGDDNTGNVKVKHSEGIVNIDVNLNAASNFAIDGVYFDPPSNPQLSWNVAGNGLKVVIHDTNTGSLDVYYGVRVLDKSTNPPASISCDPRIVNN